MLSMLGYRWTTKVSTWDRWQVCKRFLISHSQGSSFWTVVPTRHAPPGSSSNSTEMFDPWWIWLWFYTAWKCVRIENQDLSRGRAMQIVCKNRKRMYRGVRIFWREDRDRLLAWMLTSKSLSITRKCGWSFQHITQWCAHVFCLLLFADSHLGPVGAGRGEYGTLWVCDCRVGAMWVISGVGRSFLSERSPRTGACVLFLARSWVNSVDQSNSIWRISFSC